MDIKKLLCSTSNSTRHQSGDYSLDSLNYDTQNYTPSIYPNHQQTQHPSTWSSLLNSVSPEIVPTSHRHISFSSPFLSSSSLSPLSPSPSSFSSSSLPSSSSSLSSLSSHSGQKEGTSALGWSDPSMSIPPPPYYYSGNESNAINSINNSDLGTKRPLTRRLSQSHTRNSWTPEEDELLKQGYSEGLSWAMISTTYLPRRSRGCCWGRFKILQSKIAYSRRQSKQELYLPVLSVQKRTQLFKHAWRLVAQDMLGRFWDEREFESFHLANITPKQRATFLQRI